MMGRPRKHNRHLPPNVYARHSAFYYVRRGKWLRIGKTLHEALAAYASIVAEPEDGMGALIDKALAHIDSSIKPATRAQYKIAAKHLKKALVEFQPRDVKGKHIAAIKVHMKQTPNMANRCLSLLRQVFALAVEWQIVDVSPAIGIKPYIEKKRGRYITDEEYRAIYEQAGDRLQVIMDLLYFTGQRVKDVLLIRHSDIKESGIEFEPEKTRGSTGAKLVVAWTPALRQSVERAKGLQGRVAGLTLINGRRGRPLDYRTVLEQWHLACDKAEVTDVQLRDLRAKSLTDAKAQGHNATALAAHSSQTMTNRYIRRREVPLVSGPSFKRDK